MTLASKIRELRKERNLTQEQLARQSKVSVDTLRRWESGRIIPRADELVRLAFALKLTRLDVLFNVYLEEAKHEEERGKAAESAS